MSNLIRHREERSDPHKVGRLLRYTRNDILIIVGAILVIALQGVSFASELTQAQIERAEEIGSQLRCPVCRGIPINESPAELAVQMMKVVKEQIQTGKSDEEIYDYFEKRYGEWALLKPKTKGLNLSLWILPFAFLLLGAIFIILNFRGRK
jgi:cytochrome c-type biogenesis protein CcmH